MMFRQWLLSSSCSSIGILYDSLDLEFSHIILTVWWLSTPQTHSIHVLTCSDKMSHLNQLDPWMKNQSFTSSSKLNSFGRNPQPRKCPICIHTMGLYLSHSSFKQIAAHTKKHEISLKFLPLILLGTLQWIDGTCNSDMYELYTNMEHFVNSHP